MNIRRTLIAVAIVLAAATGTFAGELITPPISVPQPAPSNFIQCAATNVHTDRVNVTLEILNRNGQTIEGPTQQQLNPLQSTTIFKFLPASPPFICRITVQSTRSDLILGTAEACSFTGAGGGLFDCTNVTARARLLSFSLVP